MRVDANGGIMSKPSNPKLFGARTVYRGHHGRQHDDPDPNVDHVTLCDVLAAVAASAGLDDSFDDRTDAQLEALANHSYRFAHAMLRAREDWD
jgi:hypothetical protein